MVLKCEVCGGELEVNENLSVGKCKYCESQIVIPKDMGRKGNLYNRAVFLRQNNEFDKAIGVYEDILKENNEEAEAHWGLVLSKYGIEYVDDPRSGEKKPTIHRIQNKSILEDADYQMAVKYADLEASYQYEREGKRINQILTHLLEIAKKENPYDVFICYKESDDLGNRTEDSVIAQDIYRALEKEGYKVFFARKTLESKIGEEYEPIIYAALSSAKVMLVVGTKVEHYQAVWVKNEWSRFTEMKSTDDSKLIIPCYKGISPYELPMEIASYQALDISKIGFMQDLLDGVEKVVRKSAVNNSTHLNVNSSTLFEIETLLENGAVNLSIGNYEAAMETFRKVTKEFPGDYRGWWNLIVCKTKNFEVTNQEDYSDIMTWYTYVKKLATEEQRIPLKKQIQVCFEIFAQYDAEKKIQNAKQEIVDRSNLIVKYEKDIREINEEQQKVNIMVANTKRKLEEASNYVQSLQIAREKRKKQIPINIAMIILPYIIMSFISLFVSADILGVFALFIIIAGIWSLWNNITTLWKERNIIPSRKENEIKVRKEVEKEVRNQIKIEEINNKKIDEYNYKIQQLKEEQQVLQNEINLGVQNLADSIYESKYFKLM